MKVDVEGHEREVLRGSEGILASAQHVRMMTEVLHKRYIPEGFEVTREIFSSYEPDRVQDVVLDRRAESC
jgi:hypothetical protein